MSEPRLYSEEEIRTAIKSQLGYMPLVSEAIIRKMIEALPASEEDSYEAEAVYVDAHGTHWQFFPRDFCEEGDPPVWNTIGDANTYDFDVPARPLFKVGPVQQSEQAYADLLSKMNDIIKQYDDRANRQFGVYDVLGMVRDIVDGRD